MASATARPSFTFNLSTNPLSQPSLPRLIKIPPQISKSHSNSSTLYSAPRPHFTPAKSIDVSKENKPTSPPEEIPDNDSIEPAGEQPGDEEAPKFDKRRLEEKFAVLNTGIHECRSCGYKYDESVGDSSYPIPPGLPFDRLPDDWRCPTCGASQTFFDSKRVEIAGFAQNQQFGFGGNALTSGQKALFIYGGLGLGFLFFLSGYFLQ